MASVDDLLRRKQVRDGVAACRACALADNCTGPVPFAGPNPCNVAIVGEAPGEQEDKEGTPFVGPAGRLLRGYLRHNGMGEDVAFINAVSCFPHRTPTAREINACTQNLDDQIRVVDPRYILYVGGIALSTVWPNTRITDARGNWWQAGATYCMATWHPSAVLRNDDLRDEFQVDIEHFAMVAVGGVAPWGNWWCVKCNKYTTIRIGVNGQIAKLGMPLCGKCYATKQGVAGGGRKSSKPSPRKGKPPRTESMI